MASAFRIFLLLLIAVCPAVADPALLDIKKAAEAGDPRAQKQLAQRYEKALKFSEAEFWYKKIALTGDPEVLQALGRFYCDGKPKMSGSAPIPRNATNGLALVMLAAVQGHKSSQRDLAFQYHTGKLLPANRIRAYQLFKLSGAPSDKMYLDRMILEMPTAQIEEAEAEAKAFRPRPFREVFHELVRAHLQLQGIAGTKEKLFAIINGKTLDAGKSVVIEVAALPVEIRCDRIDKRSAAVSFLGTTAVLQVQ